MNEAKYVVEISISCDEYIPQFLAGRLERPFIIVGKDAVTTFGENEVKKFVEWLENDPSCSGNAVYESYDWDTNATDHHWEVTINHGDAVFEINSKLAEEVQP